MPRGNPTPVRTLRVPEDVWARVQGIAEANGCTVTEVVVYALRRTRGPRK